MDNPNPQVGDTIIYTISVTNYGPLAATNVKVFEYPLSGVTITDTHVTQGNYDSPPYWFVGDLNVSDTATLTITATVDTGSAGLELINTARVESLDQNDTNGTNDIATAIVTVVPDECPCDEVSSDSSPALNVVTATLMMLLTLMIGLFFVRREELLKRNER